MKLLKLVLIIFCIIIIESNVYSENLYLTNIQQKNNNYVIQLNKSISLYDIKLNEQKTDIIVPSYNNKNRSYKYFVFLDRSFKQQLANDINNNIINNKSSNIIYKINKFKIINSKVLKATFSVIFNDLLEVNATILDGKNGIWISWPSVKQNNVWKKLVVINDRNLKKNIENEVINKYNKEIKHD